MTLERQLSCWYGWLLCDAVDISRQSITLEQSDLLAAHISSLSQHFMAGAVGGTSVNP